MGLKRSGKHFRLTTFLYVVGLFEIIILAGYQSAPKLSLAAPVPAQAAQGVYIVKNATVDYPVFNVPQIDAIIKNYIAGQKTDFQDKLAGNRGDIRNHLTITYEVLYRSEQTVSLVFINKERIVGAPDKESKEYMTFAMKDKKQVTLKDIVNEKSDYQNVIAKLLHDYFKHNRGAGVSSAQLVGLLNLQIDALRDFALTNTALILYLNPHTPDNKTNAPAIAIKKELIASVLNPQYNSGLQQRSPIAITYAIDTFPPPGDTIDPSAKMLALTFDDGPGPFTSELLETLNKYEAHGTFFVLGQKVRGAEGLLRHMLDTHNEIGNHSWNHADLRRLSLPQLQHQIDDTQNVLREATGGTVPTLMRPPYGATRPEVREYLQSRGLREALWNVDTNDWLDRDAQVIYDRIMAQAADGRIVLIHDIHPTSVAAAKRAIPELKAQGYQLVTLSQLYQHRY